MNQLLTPIVEQQIRSLRRIYWVMAGGAAVILVVTVFLLAPDFIIESPTRIYGEVAMALLALALLGVVVPISRNKLLNAQTVLDADRQKLERWGLPNNIELQVGRQAIYLTRYSAGCIIGWGLSVSVGLYGLVARLLGSTPWVVGGYLAASAFALALIPPQAKKLWATLERF